MTITVDEKAKIIDAYKQHDSDTGSVEVQIAVLTSRIRQLTEHLKTHAKDHASRRGLLTMVGRRATFLKYLRRQDAVKYRDMLKRLELRH